MRYHIGRQLRLLTTYSKITLNLRSFTKQDLCVKIFYPSVLRFGRIKHCFRAKLNASSDIESNRATHQRQALAFGYLRSNERRGYGDKDQPPSPLDHNSFPPLTYRLSWESQYS